MRPAVPEEDLLALDAMARLEPHERAHHHPALPPTRAGLPKLKDRFTREAWLDYLHKHGVIAERPGGTGPRRERRDDDVEVPRWANDLAGMVTIQEGAARDEARRLARRAVRSAGRSPLFRAALCAEAARLRRDVGVTFRSGDHLLGWLRTRDWSDTRPASPVSPVEPPKTEVRRTE